MMDKASLAFLDAMPSIVNSFSRNKPMRRIFLALTLAANIVGCQLPAKSGGCQGEVCGPKAQSSEVIEVKAPQQKIVVDVPPPAACQAPAQPAPQPVMQPQQQPMMAQATTQVKERFGMGFMFDTIRIPMPIIRPVAIPRPAEMTTTMPVAPAAMMPMMMMPGAMMPGAMMPGMMPQANMGGQMSIQGSMSAQALAALMGGGQGQLNPQQMSLMMQLMGQGQLTPAQISAIIQAIQSNRSNPPPPPPDETSSTAPSSGVIPTIAMGTPSSSNAALQARLREAEQKLQQLEQLQNRSRPQPISVVQP